MALYLSEHVGDEFTGRISGVSRFGMFVTLEPSGGDGLIPISSIGNDYYVLDEERRALVGERSKIEYRLGDMLEVRLKEANKFTGGLRLELIADEDIPSFTRKSRKDQPKRPLNTRSKKGRTRSRRK
jgi:ribonuclease R